MDLTLDPTNSAITLVVWYCYTLRTTVLNCSITLQSDSFLHAIYIYHKTIKSSDSEQSQVTGAS